MSSSRQRVSPQNTYRVEVTIASGASSSAGVNLNGNKLIGIRFPATMSNGSYNVEVSDDNSDWETCADNAGNILSVVPNLGNRNYFFPLDTAHMTDFVRLKGVTNEGGDRTLEFILRPL